MEAVDISICIAFVWIALMVIRRLSNKKPRHVWGEFTSAEVVKITAKRKL